MRDVWTGDEWKTGDYKTMTWNACGGLTVQSAFGVSNGRHALSVYQGDPFAVSYQLTQDQTVPFIDFWKSNSLSQLAFSLLLACFHFSVVHTNPHRSTYPPHSSQSHRNWLSLIFLRYIAFVLHIHSLYQISQQAVLSSSRQDTRGLRWDRHSLCVCVCTQLTELSSLMLVQGLLISSMMSLHWYPTL